MMEREIFVAKTFCYYFIIKTVSVQKSGKGDKGGGTNKHSIKQVNQMVTNRVGNSKEQQPG